MGFTKYFAPDILRAEQALGRLANQLEQSHATGEALQRLDARTRDAMADGVLTEDEFEELMQRIEALGGDTQDLRAAFARSQAQDGIVDASEATTLFEGIEALSDSIGAQRQLDSRQLSFQSQLQMGIRSTRLEAVSELNALAHNGLMKVIDNV